MLQGPQEWVRYSDVLCPDVAAGTKKHCWFLHTDFSAPRCLQEGLASTTMHAKVQATHFEEKKKKTKPTGSQQNPPVRTGSS